MNRFFRRYVQDDPDRVAIVADDGHRFTYREVADYADRVSRLLEHVGAQRGDVVGALLPNGPEILMVQRGILQMPVYLSPINWHLTAPEIAYILQDSVVRLLFSSIAMQEVARDAMARVGLDEDRLVLVDAPDDHPRSLAALTAELPTGRPEVTTAGTRRLYTSGTTGAPKAVLRPIPTISPDAAAAANVERAALYGVDHEDGVYLSVAPLYHAAPLSYADQSFDLGHTVVILPKWNAEAALEAMIHHGVTWTYMVPLMFAELLKLPEAERARVTTLRAMVHTAAPCPPHVKRAMIDWVGPILTEIYGGTEGSATVITSPEWLTRQGSVGRARPGARLEIRNDDGEVLPAREIGQIYFENAALAFIYANDPEKTEASRVGGAVTLGDIGYLDEEGYLYLCDRKADTVISGGVNIYPAEIENALKEIDGVSDACVIGVPDERWGESLHAVVVLDEDAAPEGDLDDALSSQLRTRLAGFKVPRVYEYVEELPYSEAGKLLRKKVRDARTARSV